MEEHELLRCVTWRSSAASNHEASFYEAQSPVEIGRSTRSRQPVAGDLMEPNHRFDRHERAEW